MVKEENPASTAEDLITHHAAIVLLETQSAETAEKRDIGKKFVILAEHFRWEQSVLAMIKINRTSPD